MDEFGSSSSSSYNDEVNDYLNQPGKDNKYANDTEKQHDIQDFQLSDHEEFVDDECKFMVHLRCN